MITTVLHTIEYLQCRQCFGPLPQDYFHHVTGFCSEQCLKYWRNNRYGNYKSFKNHDRATAKARKLAVVDTGQPSTRKEKSHVG